MVTNYLEDISSATYHYNGGEILAEKSNQNICFQVVNTCLQHLVDDDNDKRFSEIFCHYKYRRAFFIIQGLAWQLLYKLEELESIECDYLVNLANLNIKIIHNKYIINKNLFYKMFFAVKYNSSNEHVLECLLRHIKNINNIKNPLFVKIICLWLDTFSHYELETSEIVFTQHVLLLHGRPDEEKLLQIIYNYIITQIDCLLFNPFQRDTAIWQRFLLCYTSPPYYCGSFLFYLAAIGRAFNQELLSKCRQFTITHTTDINKWSSSSDMLHSITGTVLIVTTSIIREYDERFYLSLLEIMNYKRFQQQLCSTWENDETILISEIIRYFADNLNMREYDDSRFILRTVSHKFNCLFDKTMQHEITKINLCYIILETANEKSVIIDQMIIRCFEYIENMKMIIKDEEIVHKKIERLLKGLETAFQYQYDINDLVGILKKVDLLADSINKHPCSTDNFLSKSSPDSIHAVQQLKERLTFRHHMQSSVANGIWVYSAYRQRYPRNMVSFFMTDKYY
ncbi:unnamed protein product [Didymodactylos carnosus]|uniref:Uncharacterized protein n=1 Tax=Didymodactylos carnosus TaxID=1234261 RepID=A0A8S2Q733_9BILA|nr:unnamed protein product [Didymodactylos carnosus]CAF4081969.1 unnamed protein product [Didymodactylos carnosus]